MEPNAVATTLYVPVQAVGLVTLLLARSYGGFTHWLASGGWRNPLTGVFEEEPIHLFRVVEPAGEWSEQGWRDVASAVRAGFDQHEVLLETCPCHMMLVKKDDAQDHRTPPLRGDVGATDRGG